MFLLIYVCLFHGYIFFRPSVFWQLKIKDKINAYYLATNAEKICF